MAIRREPDVQFRSCNGEQEQMFSLYSNGDSPKMTQALLAGLLQHVHSTAVEEPSNFLQKRDPQFKKLHNAITNLYCKLQGQGIGIQTSLWKVTN